MAEPEFQPQLPHQIIAQFAHDVVIAEARKVLRKAEKQRVPRKEIDRALDQVDHVIDRMIEAWPKERKL
jgi:hypothetical protein